MIVVMLVAGFGFVRILAEHWRQGTTLIGVSLLVAGLIRATLPQDRAGLLAVRSQAVDVLCYVLLGMLVVILASTVPRVPFVVQ